MKPLSRFLFLIVFLSIKIIYSQNIISGKITTEESIPIANATVINMKTEKKVSTSSEGVFSIEANVGDELRMVKNGYERNNIFVKSDDFASISTIILKRMIYTIDEVEIEYKVTGNLKKDSKHYNEPEEVNQAKIDLGRYVMKKSDPSVTALQGGDFKQPKGPGFSVGAIKNKWTDIDLIEFLVESNGVEFFTNELQLQQVEISNFIKFIFKFYERKDILKYGRVSTKDMMRFITLT